MASIVEPTPLLSQILESEENVWSNSGINSEVDEPTDGHIDEVIKHGRLLPVIHKFFYKLEKRQACTHLPILSNQTDFVRVNPEQFDPHPTTKPSERSSHGELETSVHLEREDLSVYRCTLMCAQFPVLSAPSPPENDPLSPKLHVMTSSLQHTDSVTDKIAAGDVRNQAVSVDRTPFQRHTNDFSSSLPNSFPGERLANREYMEIVHPSPSSNMLSDGTDIVSRELLCDLVRKAFGQSADQQLRYEQLLRHDFGRRSKGEILVKELVSQLKILENNAHPFYKPKLFLSKSGYDVWLQKEKRRIKQLIEKFWHYSLPSPSTWIQYNPVDYHKAYSILLDKVLSVNDDSGIHMPESQRLMVRVAAGSILSATAQRLLHEFSLRFGVGELYCCILYLDRLARGFDYQIEYLQHMKRAILDVKCLIPHSKNKVTMVKQESDILRGSIRLIKTHCEYSFTRIERLFKDSNPPSGIAALIELYQEVFDIERGVLGKHPEPLDKALKRFLKSGFVTQYERQKTLAEHSAQDSLTFPHRLSPSLIHSLIIRITEAMDVYSKFQDVFLKYVNLDIMALGRMELYALLNRDAHTLSSQVISQRESRESVSLPFLALLYRLDEVDQHWRRYVLPDMQSWRKPFTELVLIWMEVLVKQLCRWILNSLNVDQWRILKICHAPQYEECGNRGRSFSAVSLVQSEYSAFADVSVINPSRAPSSISSLSSTGIDGLTSKSKTNLSVSLPTASPSVFHISRGFRPVMHPSDERNTQSDSYLDKRKHAKTHMSAFTVPGRTLPTRVYKPSPDISPVLRHPHVSLEESSTPVHMDSGSVTPVPHLLGLATPVQGHWNDCNEDEVPQVDTTAELFLPVSNSVFDLVVMYMRLANFVANLQNTVAPRLIAMSGRQNHFSPDSSLSGDGIFYQNNWICATRQNLQRKLHKAFTSSAKLYVDNLISMDLCGIPRNEAIAVIGQETFFYLQNRKDSNEVWGCRHEVDGATGDIMESPCAGKIASDFENPTVGMCMRINNVQFILKLLPYLEKQMHYVTEKYPGRTDDPSMLLVESDTRPCVKDVGFFSKESVSLMEHVKRAQSILIHLVCFRMNKFVKGVLNVLLELALPGYTIEQRLQPLFTYLETQKSRFVQYLFPECCQRVLSTLWSYIVKDLENKALMLRTRSKELMVLRSDFLIKVTRQMMKFFYNNGKGVDVGHLISTSDFLLTMLGYFEKPSARLGEIYLSLQGTRVDPLVRLSSEFLNTLKGQLQSLRKSFSGKEFVTLFCRLLDDPMANFSDLESVSTWNRTTNREETAVDIGQLLLKQGILVQVDGVVVRDSREETLTAALSVANAFDCDGLFHFSSSEDFEGCRISIQQIPFCHSVSLNQPREVPRGTQMDGYDVARVQTLLFLRTLLLKKCTNDAERTRYRVSEPLNLPDEISSSTCTCLFKL